MGVCQNVLEAFKCLKSCERRGDFLSEKFSFNKLFFGNTTETSAVLLLINLNFSRLLKTKSIMP